ncbi:hypothetical protein DL96DRAFT_1067588 [Flagelloscypha sp. PMI_526]|nr:hypothetical protein DL96DRAFT_1067588 [Flagelloscypha sp. PMI_526]
MSMEEVFKKNQGYLEQYRTDIASAGEKGNPEAYYQVIRKVTKWTGDKRAYYAQIRPMIIKVALQAYWSLKLIHGSTLNNGNIATPSSQPGHAVKNATEEYIQLIKNLYNFSAEFSPEEKDVLLKDLFPTITPQSGGKNGLEHARLTPQRSSSAQAPQVQQQMQAISQQPRRNSHQHLPIEHYTTQHSTFTSSHPVSQSTTQSIHGYNAHAKGQPYPTPTPVLGSLPPLRAHANPLPLPTPAQQKQAQTTTAQPLPPAKKKRKIMISESVIALDQQNLPKRQPSERPISTTSTSSSKPARTLSPEVKTAPSPSLADVDMSVVQQPKPIPLPNLAIPSTSVPLMPPTLKRARSNSANSSVDVSLSSGVGTPKATASTRAANVIKSSLSLLPQTQASPPMVTCETKQDDTGKERIVLRIRPPPGNMLPPTSQPLINTAATTTEESAVAGPNELAIIESTSELELRQKDSVREPSEPPLDLEPPAQPEMVQEGTQMDVETYHSPGFTPRPLLPLQPAPLSSTQNSEDAQMGTAIDDSLAQLQATPSNDLEPQEELTIGLIKPISIASFLPDLLRLARTPRISPTFPAATEVIGKGFFGWKESDPGSKEIEFPLNSIQLAKIRGWLHAKETSTTNNLDQRLCITLACYPKQTIEKELAVHKNQEGFDVLQHAAVLDFVCQWPQDGEVSLDAQFEENPAWFPLSPPIKVTEDGLVDASSFIVEGTNRWSFNFDSADIGHIFILRIHPPTPAMVDELQRMSQFQQPLSSTHTESDFFLPFLESKARALSISS